MRKIFLILLFLCVATNSFAATQLKKTVCPSGCDYTSLETCMNANEQNLVTADKYFDVEISGSWASVDTNAVTIENYTTDATRYINIYTTGSAKHGGTLPDQSGNQGYVLKPTTGTGITIATGQNNVTINGLAIDLATSNGNGIITNQTQTGGTLTYKNNLIHGSGTSDYGIYSTKGIDSGTSYIFNNIVYGFDVVGILPHDGADYFTTDYIYSNTVYNCATCFNLTNQGYATTHFSNNTALNCSAQSIWRPNYANSGSNNICSTNVGECTTAPLTSGTNNATSYSSYFVSVTGGSENFHVKDASSILYNAGADLGASYNTDIDGDSRPQVTTWDVGADEFTAPAATAVMSTTGSMF